MRNTTNHRRGHAYRVLGCIAAHGTTVAPASRRWFSRFATAPGSARGIGVILSVAALLAVSALPSHADETQQPAGRNNDLLERMQQAVETLVGRVSPAVVAIRADRGPTSTTDDTTAAPISFSTGSGVIIRQDGMILTSQHVIDGAIAVHVVLPDGRRFRAIPLAADRRSDLAVLRIDAAGLPVVRLGDVRDVRRGHIVFALGNPLGLAGDGQTAVSQGLVSAIGRPLPETFGRSEDRYYGDMIQTSARVSPGNSGGPLIDIHGRVIGIVTLVGSPVGGRGDGIGFAVPIGPDSKAVIKRLLEGRQVEYGYIGVQVSTPTDVQIRAAGLSDRSAALIDSVLADGPADREGLQGGDLIVFVNKTAVQSADHFVRLIGAAGPGQEVEITFIRASKRHNATVKLARRRSPDSQHLSRRTVTFRGATLSEVDPAMHDWGNLPGYALLVLMVNDGSPADHAGLTPGDIIVRIEGQHLTPEASARLGELSGDVLLGLANGGSALIKE